MIGVLQWVGCRCERVPKGHVRVFVVVVLGGIPGDRDVVAGRVDLEMNAEEDTLPM